MGLIEIPLVCDRWQARKVGDRNMRAGLIPSRQLQERRILAHRQDQTANGQSESSSAVSEQLLCLNFVVPSVYQ